MALTLRAGDTLLTYSDGATELRSRPPTAGEAALRRAVAEPTASAQELVERIERQALALSDGLLRDDLVLLALKVPEGCGERRTLAAHRRRVAANEAHARAINERIQAERGIASSACEALGFSCECGDRSCERLVDLSVADDERARAHPRRFVITPGHDFSSSERVVEKQDAYWVVEKHAEAGVVAEQRDPRQ